MAKTKSWFQTKMKEFRNDPEFLHEYISLLNDEIDFVKNYNLDLIRIVKLVEEQVETKVRLRFNHIINGKGPIIPRIAVKIAIDDIFKPRE